MRKSGLHLCVLESAHIENKRHIVSLRESGKEGLSEYLLIVCISPQNLQAISSSSVLSSS